MCSIGSKEQHGLVFTKHHNTSKCVSRHCSQIISLATEERALYSASADELATVGCFLDFQETRESPRKILKPIVDLLVSILLKINSFCRSSFLYLFWQLLWDDLLKNSDTNLENDEELSCSNWAG